MAEPKLPRAIAEQQAALAQIEAQMAGQQPPPPEPQAQPAPAEVTPAVQLPETAPPAPAAPELTAEEKERVRLAEARYNALKGEFNKLVPALQRQVKEQEEALAELREQMKQKAPPEQKPGADPKDVEKFGEELVEWVQRYVTQMLDYSMKGVQAAVGSLAQRVDKLDRGVAQATQVGTTTAEQMFLAQLDSLVPGWKADNEKPGFLLWLDEVDAFSGRKRQDLLNGAGQAMDAQRVAAIFQAWRQTLPTPAASPTPLEMQVTPGATVGSGAPGAVPAKPRFTSAQITAFYTDVARGRYKGREQEAARTEAEINQAVAEGRVS